MRGNLPFPGAATLAASVKRGSELSKSSKKESLELADFNRRNGNEQVD
jgi:hypothetical protein